MSMVQSKLAEWLGWKSGDGTGPLFMRNDVSPMLNMTLLFNNVWQRETLISLSQKVIRLLIQG